MQIYIMRDGERTGPYVLEEINRQLAAGTLSPLDQAWSEGSPGWKALLSFPGVIMPGGASSTAIPLGTATVAHVGSTRYAGFWIRAVAGLIDGVFLALLFVLTQLISGEFTVDAGLVPPSDVVLFSAIALGYWAILWSSKMQGTLGQRICQIKVVNAVTRERISFLRALGRAFALVLASAIFFIGVLMVAFTERKRGLHDMIADTYVVKDQ
jgi:uncharacterized RDD family membrane protein YckC